jgi:hypothetical protein
MTAAERNQATLVDLYKHLGPGLGVGMDAYRRTGLVLVCETAASLRHGGGATAAALDEGSPRSLVDPLLTLRSWHTKPMAIDTRAEARALGASGRDFPSSRRWSSQNQDCRFDRVPAVSKTLPPLRSSGASCDPLLTAAFTKMAATSRANRGRPRAAGSRSATSQSGSFTLVAAGRSGNEHIPRVRGGLPWGGAGQAAAGSGSMAGSG